MRRRRAAPALVIAAAAALVAGCAASSGRARGLEPSGSAAEALAAPLAPRRLALVIGVDDYARVEDLRHAAADATALGERLADPRAGRFDDVKVLAGAPTRDELVAALRALRAEVRRGDTVVVMFSGHGTRVADGGRWRRFVLPADADPAALDATALDLELLQQVVRELPAAHKALIVDACFDGDGRSAVRPGAAGAPEPPIGDLTPSETMVGVGEWHLYATSAGRPAREDDRLGHGVYTHFLLDALGGAFREADLDGDGVVTAWEAHDHARGRAVDFTGGVQVPEGAFRVRGGEDLVLVGDPAARAARSTALLYRYARGPLGSAEVQVDGRARGAFPGTVPLPPGRHHVVLTGADGEDLVAGTVRLRPGGAYDAAEIARVVHGPRRLLGARGLWIGAPALGVALGGGILGGEAHGAVRADRGPAAGLTGRLGLGLGVAPARDVGGLSWPAPRAAAVARVGLGLQRDVGRVRLRGGIGATALWLPPAALVDRPLRTAPGPDEAGWFALALGPEAGLGLPFGRGLALGVDLGAHGAWLDVDGDGRARLGAVPSVAVGVELAP